MLIISRFPYTPTVHFPHPLANIKSSNVEPKYSNFMSYPLVEIMTWQGLGDLINRFRQEVLCLEEVSTLWAPGQLYRLRVPYTYMWSPALVPKPKDWGAEIDISGFVFLDLASSFEPPSDLKAFLDKGDPPVYIGFGSIVVDDPDSFTQLIFDAVKLVGCRALVSKGWGGFGSNSDCPENVFMLENSPHDWLFPRCSAVVHHGGAGTTAIGLKTAKPTMIVPFFGDQPFWGAMVSKAKAGAHECIPFKKLNAERLAEGIKQCLTDEAKQNVQKIADSIADEGDGALNAVRSFHRSLPLHGDKTMRCDLLSNRTAVWRIKKSSMRLSPLAVEILVEKKWIKRSELRLLRHYEWNDFGGPGEPLTGAWGSLLASLTDAAAGVGGIPIEMGKSIKKREKIREKKRKVEKRRKAKKATNGHANPKTSTKKDESDNKENQNEGKSRPTANRNETSTTVISEPDQDLAEELGHEAVSGVQKTGGAIAHLPMNFLLALTNGFHNAPRLFGDETVRPPPRVTGFHSGLRAGRDELVYGVKDGFTGTVMQPYRGAQKDGVTGLMRGVGVGLGGLVLKNIAAFLGPAAYSLKGLDAEYMKRYQPTAYLRDSRMRQGQKELQMLGKPAENTDSEQESERNAKLLESREDIESRVVKRWLDLQQKEAGEKIKNQNKFLVTLRGKGDKKKDMHMKKKKKSSPDLKKDAARPSSSHSHAEGINGHEVNGAEKTKGVVAGHSQVDNRANATSRLSRSVTAPAS